MKRPIGVTFLVLLVCFAAVGNCLRLCEAVFFWRVLEEYNTYPLYIAISGGFWLLAAVFLIIGIWRGKSWAWAWTIGSMSGYGSWYWFDRLVLQVPHANWSFALVFTALLAGFSALILFRTKTRTYFNNLETSHE